MLSPEGLRASHFQCQLSCPPVRAFGEDELNQILPKIGSRFGFRSFSHTAEGGALLEGPSGIELSIEVGRLSFKEQVGSTHISVGIENLLDLVAAVREHLQLPLLLAPQIQIGALWALEGETADAMLSRRTAIAERFDLTPLGDPILGIRMVTRSQPPEPIYDVRVEPFFENPSLLYLEINGTHPAVVVQDDTSVLRAAAEGTYQQLKAMETVFGDGPGLVDG